MLRYKIEETEGPFVFFVLWDNWLNLPITVKTSYKLCVEYAQKNNINLNERIT